MEKKQERRSQRNKFLLNLNTSQSRMNTLHKEKTERYNNTKRRLEPLNSEDNIRGKKALQEGLNFLTKYSEVMNPRKNRVLSLGKIDNFKKKNEVFSKSKFSKTSHSRAIVNRAALRISKNVRNKEKFKIKNSEYEALKNLYKRDKIVNGGIIGIGSVDRVDFGEMKKLDVIKIDLNNVSGMNMNVHLY